MGLLAQIAELPKEILGWIGSRSWRAGAISRSRTSRPARRPASTQAAIDSHVFPTGHPPSARTRLYCSGGSPAHRLFNQPNDDHHDTPADSAGSDLTNNRADIKVTRPSGGGSRSDT